MLIFRAQEPVLFNGTVFDNISHGLVGTELESSSREEKLKLVKEAATTAFADDFIQNLPHGYDTRIGERGGLLSGGQKQRVAIARSIISHPKILLLDEATSALDPHAERIVQKALDRASENRTTIVIAHKLKTVCNADNILVLSQGRIVEQGKHHELVAANGTYAHLVKAQDLSTAAQGEGANYGEKDDTKQAECPVDAERVKSLARYNTLEAENLSFLQTREDFSAYKRTSIVSSIYKLIRSTWDLRWWYLLTVICCILGGMYFRTHESVETALTRLI